MSEEIFASVALIITKLSSEHDGEIIAVARAIQRKLKSGNLDLHDLAERINSQRSAKPRAPDRPTDPWTQHAREAQAKRQDEEHHDRRRYYEDAMRAQAEDIARKRRAKEDRDRRYAEELREKNAEADASRRAEREAHERRAPHMDFFQTQYVVKAIQNSSSAKAVMTDWEKEFIESLTQRMSTGAPLTERQHETLNVLRTKLRNKGHSV